MVNRLAPSRRQRDWVPPRERGNSRGLCSLEGNSESRCGGVALILTSPRQTRTARFRRSGPRALGSGSATGASGYTGTILISLVGSSPVQVSSSCWVSCSRSRWHVRSAFYAVLACDLLGDYAQVYVRHHRAVVEHLSPCSRSLSSVRAARRPSACRHQGPCLPRRRHGP